VKLRRMKGCRFVFVCAGAGRGRGKSGDKKRVVEPCFVLQSPLVNPHAAAEQHLRVIRSLMERATAYRALSAPAAAFGGALSLLTAAGLELLRSGAGVSLLAFTLAWLAVLVATVVVSALLLRRDAVRRGEPFFSAGARSAALAMLPPLLAGAALSAVALFRGIGEQVFPGTWSLFYGLALLAMTHFAPRSIARLGWTFFAAGLAIMTGLADTLLDMIVPTAEAGRRANLCMGATFGLLHLFYAVCTWPRDRDERRVEL
jgi:hypothetical protein